MAVRTFKSGFDMCEVFSQRLWETGRLNVCLCLKHCVRKLPQPQGSPLNSHPELAEHPGHIPPAQSTMVGQDVTRPRVWSAQQQQAVGEKLGSTGHGGLIGGCSLPCSGVPYQIWPEVTQSSSEEGAWDHPRDPSCHPPSPSWCLHGSQTF